MLLQKAIETPHRMPKPKSSKAGDIADGTTLGTILPTAENPNLFRQKSRKIGLRKMKRNS
ncbi:unnamed protein product [Prunus brigantina]